MERGAGGGQPVAQDLHSYRLDGPAWIVGEQGLQVLRDRAGLGACSPSGNTEQLGTRNSHEASQQLTSSHRIITAFP